MTKTMKAAVLHAPGDIRFENVPVPSDLHKKEVLVKVRAAGICGSDLDRIMKTGTYSFPTIPGHEFCGIVEKTGDEEKGFKKGDRVVVAPIIPCFSCESCQQGHYGQCASYNYLGSRTDGGFAQYVKAPVMNLIRMPAEVSYKEGAAIEPAAVTLHGMRRVGVETGDTVAVLGCGTLGLFALQFAKIMGATRTIAVDIAEEKLELAQKLGADELVCAQEKDPVTEIKKMTEGRGPHAAIETAGVSITQEQCLRIAAKHGRILYLGTAHKDVVIPAGSFEHIVRNELLITGSWNSYSAPFPGREWHASVDYVKKKVIKIEPLITHTFVLEDASKVFRDLAERRYVYNKVMFEIN
ncbi:MAG TPA: galactitol-1-phosphate 5-dehydrogenase [Spirochaetes bacterium]|nr:galactitol-1-phosphate 5-dehydrogenase [Spirochaetota bacterium]